MKKKVKRNGHRPGMIIKMSDREYKVGKDGEYRRYSKVKVSGG